MKQTNTSKILYPTWTIKVKAPIWRADTANAFAIRPIIICPALIFAISRTIKVNGRMQILTVSIITNKGTKAAGAPAGARWAADSIGNFNQPDKISRPQNTNAKDPTTQMFLVTPYTNGISPNKFLKRINPINLNTNRGTPGKDFCRVSLLVDSNARKILW